jgi:hypothetical protein
MELCIVQWHRWIPILILTWESEFWSRHRKSDCSTRFKYKAFFTEISQKFYFDCLSEFWFRPSKSKFQLLLIIATNIFCWKSKINFDRNSDWNSDEINFVGNPIIRQIYEAHYLTLTDGPLKRKPYPEVLFTMVSGPLHKTAVEAFCYRRRFIKEMFC